MPLPTDQSKTIMHIFFNQLWLATVIRGIFNEKGLDNIADIIKKTTKMVDNVDEIT